MQRAVLNTFASKFAFSFCPNLDASEEKSEEKKKNLSLPTSSSKETGNSRDQR